MIIFINGPINSGKTTVAKILAERIPDTALLEIDLLREFIKWMPIDQAVPINLENAVLIIKTFCHRKINVIVPYPLSEGNYNYLMSELKSLDDKIYVFTLSPKIEKALSNRGDRELNDWEKERVKHHYSIGIHQPHFGEIIDNSKQIPDETASYIMDRIIK